MGCKHFPLSVCKDCQIETLTSQVIRLKELCGDGLKIIKDLGNNNIFSHKAVADFEQRLNLVVAAEKSRKE